MVAETRGRRTSQHERDESPSERADRNFIELVQELRVAQIGVQILFGFFLTLSFYDTFPRDQPFPQVLTVALVATMLATLFFMAPVVAHRMHFREGAKERLVWMTHRMTYLGMIAMGVAMELGVWLVLAWLWSLPVATWTCLGLGVVMVLLWVVWPRMVLHQPSDDSPS